MALAIEGMLCDSELRRLASIEGEKLKKHLDPASVAQLFENVYLQALSRG